MCGDISTFSTVYYTHVMFFCCCEEGIPYKNLIFLRELDSIEVNNTFYYNIKVFESDSINPQTIRKFYYAKNTGLIMYEDFENNNWILIEYEGNQY